MKGNRGVQREKFCVCTGLKALKLFIFCFMTLLID